MQDTAPRWLKPATEYLPLGVFFVAYLTGGLMAATVALLVTTVIGLGVSLVVLRRVPWLPLVTAVVVGIFGGLTLWLHDDMFIKLKPTIVNAIFSLLLLGGLAIGKTPLQLVLGKTLALTETGWRKLTLRFGLFFAAMAVLNEVVWRTQSTDVWVTFKVFGLIGLTVAFTMAQMPLIMRHRLEQD